jgi:hypothetical protein
MPTMAQQVRTLKATSWLPPMASTFSFPFYDVKMG